MIIQTVELALMVQWITRREAVRQAKEHGLPKPWTDDPLLRDFRWCNVRRMDDRVSRWLMTSYYSKHESGRDALGNAIFARLINWPDSLDVAQRSLDSSHGKDRLKRMAAEGKKVFTGAYIVPGKPGEDKIDTVFRIALDAYADGDRILGATMKATWANLCRREGLGSFLAGQVVADLAHLPAGAAWPDVDYWAPLGPGSARGINRLMGRPKAAAISQDQFEHELSELITVLRPYISEIWHDRKLQAMDVQNCLCEFDKYRRLQLGEGKVRARYDGGAETSQAVLL